MNTIINAITPDGCVGFDTFGQLCHWTKINGTGTIIHDVRGMTCVICNQGWELTAPSLGDQTYWRTRKQWVHASCMTRFWGLLEHDDVYTALVRAKIRFNDIEPWPNGYYRENARPWYRVVAITAPDTTPVVFIIGMRKRVWSLEVEGLEVLPNVFAAEDVTKAFSSRHMMIHAWSTAKLAEYLKAIADATGLSKW